MYQLLILATCVVGVFTQAIQTGTCNINGTIAQSNFNVTMFLGTWYQIERIPNSDEIGHCASITYSSVNGTLANTTVASLSNREVANRQERIRTGSLSRTNVNDTSGRLVATYTGVQQQYPYVIVVTDYINYALLYSCIDFTNNTRAVYAWKLSRTTTLSTMQSAAINLTLSGANPALLNHAWLTVEHSQTACHSNASLLSGSAILMFLLAIISNFNFNS